MTTIESLIALIKQYCVSCMGWTDNDCQLYDKNCRFLKEHIKVIEKETGKDWKEFAK